MATLCKYCDAPIIWIAKPAGGWFRPFDAPEELLHLDYEVRWDKELQDWVAAPLDTEITAKLREHDCPRRREIIAQRRAQEQEEQEERPALDRLNAEPAEYPPIPTRRSLPERVVYRNPSPEQYVRIAERLKQRCPTCKAMPFHWCTYADNPNNAAQGRVGRQTDSLHTARR
jgi:hypothetical protein